jgi:hypothetical protein
MKLRFLIIILIFSTAYSCGKKKADTEKAVPPAEIVSADEMENILVDVFLAEGAVGVSDVYHQDVRYYTRHYYNFILKKHNITAEQFQKSFEYYASELDEMEKIMTDVIDNLSQKQSQVRNE